MSAFDRVIGYETIKNELMQICDMINNPEFYVRLGAKLSRGVLLYGDPGLGKSLLAKCFIQESGLKSYTVRRNKGNDDFVGEISETFKEAKENAPSIVFLDDMDKFANEDVGRCDAPEYVAVQAGIDEVMEKDVFVIATVNKYEKLPKSLTRPGRFDIKIEVECPSEDEAEKIIRFYLSNKMVSDDVNMEDVSKMIRYNSCAELEAVINNAAISAAFNRKNMIGMDDILHAVLRTTYDSLGDFTMVDVNEDELRKTAVHEAGHAVVCEVLCPQSVGIVSLRKIGQDSIDGFMRRCRSLKRRPYYVMVSLAGKAATEMYYCDTVASGCDDDLKKAANLMREGILYNASMGLGLLNVRMLDFRDVSDEFMAKTETVTQAELERLLLKTRDILLKNRDFLEKVTEALIKKGTLTFSDIQAIKGECVITQVAV